MQVRPKYSCGNFNSVSTLTVVSTYFHWCKVGDLSTNYPEQNSHLDVVSIIIGSWQHLYRISVDDYSTAWVQVALSLLLRLEWNNEWMSGKRNVVLVTTTFLEMSPSRRTLWAYSRSGSEALPRKPGWQWYVHVRRRGKAAERSRTQCLRPKRRGRKGTYREIWICVIHNWPRGEIQKDASHSVHVLVTVERVLNAF